MNEEHPIIFSTEMVRALREKRQTRRIAGLEGVNQFKWRQAPTVKLVSDKGLRFVYAQFYEDSAGFYPNIRCPYGKVGDKLWVRESYIPNYAMGMPAYKADLWEDVSDLVKQPKWVSAIHMPRAACRTVLEITDIRVERVQQISEGDVWKEGIKRPDWWDNMDPWHDSEDAAQELFAELWDKINAKPKPKYTIIGGKKVISHYVSYPWQNIQQIAEYRDKPLYIYGNPWIWVISFRHE